MKIEKSYIFERNGIKGIACGYKPKDCEILETVMVLIAKEGFELWKDGENFSNAVVLGKESDKDLYSEEEIKEEEVDNKDLTSSEE